MLRVRKPTQPGEESCYFTYQTWMESGNEDADTMEFRKPKGMKRNKRKMSGNEGQWLNMLNLLYKSSMLVFLRWFLDVTWKQVCKWLPLWLDVFCLDGFDEVEPMKDFLKNLGNQETGTRTRLMWTLYQGFNAICRGMKTLDKNNVLCWSKNVLFVASSHWSRP